MVGPAKAARRQAMRDAGYVACARLMWKDRRAYGAVHRDGRAWIPPEHRERYDVELAARKASQAAAERVHRDRVCHACGCAERVGCCGDWDCNLERCAACGAEV